MATDKSAEKEYTVEEKLSTLYQLQTMMTEIDKYCELSLDELKSKLKQYVEKKNLKFNLIKEYLPLFPDKVYKNIYNGGLMNELV